MEGMKCLHVAPYNVLLKSDHHMISCGRLCINLHDFSGEKIISKFKNLA